MSMIREAGSSHSRPLSEGNLRHRVHSSLWKYNKKGIPSASSRLVWTVQHDACPPLPCEPCARVDDVAPPVSEMRPGR